MTPYSIEDLRKLVAEMRALGVSKLKLDDVEVELAPAASYVPVGPSVNYPWQYPWYGPFYTVANNGGTYLPNNGTFEINSFPTTTAGAASTYPLEWTTFQNGTNGVTFTGTAATIVPTNVTIPWATAGKQQ